MSKTKGGSVLKKLRTHLKAAGVIGQPKGKKSKVKGKQGQTVKPRTREISNPFEIKSTRRKHEVIGQKVRGVVGKPGISRKRGEEKVK